MSYHDSSLWQRTLASQGENDSQLLARERLRSSYELFRRHVTPLAAEIAQSVPNYTDHSILHSDSLWDTASTIVGQDYPLNPAEAFVLGGAFLIHDLGMGVSAHSRGLPGILAQPEWLDLLTAIYSDDAKSLQEQAISDVADDPTWNGLSSSKTKQALTLYLREHHAELAENIVQDYWRLTSGENFYLLPDTELRHWYGAIIGRLGMSHWENVDSLAQLFATELGAVPGFPTAWTVDPLKLACILRVADAAQIDARRADPLHTPHRQPQGDSEDHWVFQERMLIPQASSSRLIYTSSTDFDHTRSGAWWLCYDTIKMVDEELRRVDSLLSDLRRPAMAVKGVGGADTPSRFSEFVQPKGWTPIDARPFIGNPAKVISNLGGSALYGASAVGNQVGLRELIANGIDAMKARRAAYGEDGLKPLLVRFSREVDQDVLTVRDYGIGMDPYDITRHLCNFGESGWTSNRTRRELPGAISAGFRPTGKYGVGFFSIFMLAKRVTVVTRTVSGAMSDTMVLEFKDGPAGRPILRQAHREERLLEPGTEVTAHLLQRANAPRGLFGSLSQSKVMSSTHWAKTVRRLALMSPETIQVSAPQSIEKVIAVSGDAWQSVTSAELVETLTATDLEATSRWDLTPQHKIEIADLLKPLSDENGRTIGRLAISPRARVRSSDYYRNRATIYCGGMLSEYLPQTFGVIEGKPTRAARDQARIDVSLDNMRAWFREQVKEARKLPLRDIDKLSIQSLGTYFGDIIEDFPIIAHKQGYLTPAELRKLIEPTSIFEYDTTDIGSIFPGAGGFGYLLLSEMAIGILPENFYLVAYPEMSRQEVLPGRPNEYAELWKDYEQIGDSFDAIAWWQGNFNTPEAEVVRQVSKAWAIPIPKLLTQVQLRQKTQIDDDRATIYSADGSPVRVVSTVLHRLADWRDHVNS